MHRYPFNELDDQRPLPMDDEDWSTWDDEEEECR